MPLHKRTDDFIEMDIKTMHCALNSSTIKYMYTKGFTYTVYHTLEYCGFPFL